MENNIVSVERVNEYAETPKEVGSSTMHGPHCITGNFVIPFSTPFNVTTYRPVGIQRAASCLSLGLRVAQ